MALTENSVSIDDANLLKEPKLAIIMGTEGDGLPMETIVESDYVVRIPHVSPSRFTQRSCRRIHRLLATTSKMRFIMN